MIARRSIPFIILTLLVFAGMANAQATRPAGRRAGADMPGLQRLQDAIAGLDLSDDQKKQVASLKDEVAETIRGMAGELKDLPPAERREKVKASLGDVREKFMSILTPEQKEKLKAQRPGLGQGEGGGRRPLAELKAGKKGGDSEAPMIARLRDALDGVGLSPEQKSQTDAILDDAKTQALQIRSEAANDRDAAREKATELARTIRQKLAAVLTAEQRQKLAESMPGGRGGGQRKADRAAPATKPADAKSTSTTPIDSKTPGPAAAKAAVASSRPAASPLVVGGPAPAFTLTRLNGSSVTNKTFLDKPLVLAFGSLTSPAFRDRMPQLQALQTRYRGRATVAVVYTREAHPADGWQVERNRDDKLEINRPTTDAERVALARQLHDRFKTSLDVYVDAIDDATLTAFGDNADGAAVLGRTGTLVGTQKFCDPSGLPRMIELALQRKD